MPTIPLPDRAVIEVSGAEARHFLQNLVTTDIDALPPGEVRPGALLSPQGKIMFDFLVAKTGEDCFLLDVRADMADDFIRRLTLYKLRAKVQIAKQEQLLVAVEWQNDSASSQTDSTGLSDRRFPDGADVKRLYASEIVAQGERPDWDALRIAHGVAESGADYALGDAFPHDVLLDQNGGVGFRKGCFVGQEVVSRMQHRGTARRRVLIATGDSALPEPGTDITANGRPIGSLGSVAGRQGLAVVRIDRVKEAQDKGQPVMAGDAALTFEIPGWATFAFPETPASDTAS